MNPDPAFWSGRPVLITGHTGFKGSWLTLWLSRLGADLSGFSLEPPTTPSMFDLSAGDRIADNRGDVRDLSALKTCLAAVRPKVVFHMAAQSLVRASYREPVATYATNVMGTVNLLESVRETDSVEAVIVVTSDKCYENREWIWPYRESDPMGGHDPYSNSKGCAELVTASYRASFFSDDAARRCRIATGRAGNVIGGGDWSQDRLVPDIVRGFAASRSVEIRNPAAIRPWQHVLEPLAGYLRLAEMLCTPEGHSFAEGWNFGPAIQDCQPVSSVVDRLAAVWGRGAAWHLSGTPGAHEANYLKVDASKAQARLGWQGRLGLAEALSWTAEWYQAQLDGTPALDLTLDQIVRFEISGSH